jgi:hypothetical protein
VLSADISPSGKDIMSTGIDGTVRRWSAETGDGLVIRWLPVALYGGCYSADGTRYSVSHRGGFFVTDPAVPAIPQDQLGAWLDATTTATVDDAGHVGGPGAPSP